MEDLSLLDSIRVELVLNDLLLQHLITEFELIYTVDEILLWQEVNARIGAGARDSHVTDFRIVNDFFKAERLIDAYQVKSDHFLQFEGLWGDLIITTKFLEHDLTAWTHEVLDLLCRCFLIMRL